MKHLYLLLAGLTGAPLAWGQVSSPLIAVVPAPDPTVTANSYLPWTNGQPRQRPAWVSQHTAAGAVNLWRYTYNAAGQITLMVVSDSLSGQLQARQTNTYHPSGKLATVTDERWFNGAPAGPYTYAHSYDAQGNLTRTSTGGGAVYEYSYTYDAAGVITAYNSAIQQPGQARLPYQRINFAVQNGQWRGCTQEEYQQSAWQTLSVVHRLSWRNWARRQPQGSRVTRYNYVPGPVEQRDTVRYAALGADTVVSRATEQLSAGSWAASTTVRARLDGQNNRVAQSVRLAGTTGAATFIMSQDSSAFLYDAQGQLRRQRIYTTFGNPGPLNYSATIYYGPASVTGTRRAAELELSLSPNPTTGRLTLLVPALPAAAPVQAEVLNALGQVLERRSLPARGGALLEHWDVSRYPTGVYLLRLHTAAGSTTRRFVKQ